MSLRDLPTLTEAQRVPRAKPKGVPHQLVKKAAKKSKDELAEAFRKAVWKRDKGRSRATGRTLVKSGVTDWAKLGEVDHVIDRSLAPERIYDTSNGILLSKEENRLKKVACPRAPEFRMFSVEGPDDRSFLQVFTWRDEDGHIKKQTTG